MVRRFEDAPDRSLRPSPPASTTMEGLIEAAVERAIRRTLGPYLHRLSACEPAVYTVAQTAQILQVSEDTVSRMVRRGTLPRVPHVDGKVLIPRRALDWLTQEGQPAGELTGSAREAEARSLSISSAAS